MDYLCASEMYKDLKKPPCEGIMNNRDKLENRKKDEIDEWLSNHYKFLYVLLIDTLSKNDLMSLRTTYF